MSVFFVSVADLKPYKCGRESLLKGKYQYR
jgi:hypothetical protein